MNEKSELRFARVNVICAVLWTLVAVLRICNLYIVYIDRDKN